VTEAGVEPRYATDAGSYVVGATPNKDDHVIEIPGH
jgi:hypothetical protein